MPPLKKEIVEEKKVKKRATQIIIGLKHLYSHERLINVRIFSLWGMIMTDQADEASERRKAIIGLAEKRNQE